MLEGICGTLPPTALKPSFNSDGEVGECNGAIRGLTEYKTGTNLLVIRAPNPDGVAGHSTGELNKGSKVTPIPTNIVCTGIGTEGPVYIEPLP